MNAIIAQFMDLDGTGAVKRRESQIECELLKASGEYASQRAKLQLIEDSINTLSTLITRFPGLAFEDACAWVGLNQKSAELLKAAVETEAKNKKGE